MRVFASIWDKGILRGALALTVVLVAATAPAETLRVTAANSVGNSLYDVTAFAPPPATSGGTLSLLNSDGRNHGSFSSVVLVPNLATGTVDAIVADLTGPAGAAGGQILRYTPALGSTPASVTIVWSYNGSGPINPDGLSLDSAGNLFIVTSKPPQIWVLPVNAGSPTGFASAPLLIHGSFPTGQGVLQLQDTVVATTNYTVWHTDDVLLMVGNKNSTSNQNTNNDDVYLYKASTIQNVLAGSGPVSAPDQILINGTQFPLGEYGLGLDFWPADFSNPNPHPTLLVLTTAGHILQWDFSSGVPVAGVFASGLGTGLAKLKVGLQLGIPYAYVTQALPASPTGSGRILQLGATSGVLNIVGTLATPNVMSPDGLAVDPLGAATAASCKATNGGCDISGVIPHKVVVASDATTPAGNVIEATCVVPQDPRVDAGGNCDATRTLKVSDYCPGFGNEIIPGTLCGGSGVTKTGFALVRTNATGVDNIAGILVNSEANIDHILPAASNPLCPTSTYAWVPYSAANPSEGTLIPNDVDPGTGYYNFVEMTSFCGTSGGANRGMSVYAVGLIYKPQVTFATDAQNKYQDLFTTVDTANIVTNTKSSLEACLSPITSYIGQADYACAATQTVRCNTQVASDTSPARHYPGAPLGNPNPWGEIQGRLGNLYMQVNTRLQGNPANHAWPLGSNDAQPSCAAPIVVSFTAPSITSGQSALLSWSTQHAYSCQVGGVTFTGSQAANGTLSTGPLSSSKNYALTCTGISGQVKSSVTVHVSK